MTKEEKNELKKIALESNSLHRYSRLGKIIKKPSVFIPYTLYWLFSKIFFPIKVNYTTLWGDKMRFYIPEGNEIYSYGFFEIYLFNFMINNIEEGDIVIDVGAHVGLYTKLMSRLVGGFGQVHSFEPTKRTFETLKYNTVYNKNIKINNIALLNEEKEIDFKDYGPSFSVFNTFQKRTGVSYLPEPESYRVKTTTLDKYFIENNIEKCKFIKIDAEGAESLILQGMDYVLDNINPIVSIEVGGGDEWKDNNQASIKYLLNKGYKMYKIDENGDTHPHQQESTYQYDNLVFVK